jgi:hypothetical protein
MMDVYGNADADARCAYYNISITPTAVFDGTVTEQPYTAWEGILNTREDVKSPLKIELEVALTGNNFEATVAVTRGGDVPASGLKLHFAVTENGLTYNSNPINHILRKMYPNANGTAVTLPAAATTEFTIKGTLNNAWHKNQLHYIAWVQNESTKEIYQAKLITASEVTTGGPTAMAAVAGVYR